MGSARRVKARAVTAPVLATILVTLLAACGQGPAATPALGSAAEGSPPATGAVADLPEPLPSTGVALARSSQQLSLPYREYRQAGSLSLADTTDATAAFTENGRTRPRVWLMDLASGNARLVLDRATCGRAGFWVGTVQLSDTWLAWEEVGPGDDLVERVEWRLYAAPLRRPSLTLGAPRLVAASSNVQAARPLFDVSGARLAWISTAWRAKGTAGVAQVMLRDLGTGERRAVYRSHGALETVSFSGAELVVGEAPDAGRPAARLLVLRLADGRCVRSFAAGNRFALAHWPAWRDGWLSWTPFPSAEAAYPLLYVRAADGTTATDGGYAIDPCFAGDYLFYQTWRPSARPYEPDTAEVRAVRVGTHESFILETGKPDENAWWHGVVGAPVLKHTYVTYLDHALFAERAADKYTVIRVYDLR